MNCLVLILLLTQISTIKSMPLVCYYILNQPDISLVPKHLCDTIILINSVHISEEGELEYYENGLQQFSKLYDKKTNLFVSITSPNPTFSYLTSSPDLMVTFAKDVTQMLKSYNLNGVDVDWEFPVWSKNGRKTDRYQFSVFLKIMKTELQSSDMKLSVAVSGPPTISRVAYDVEALSKYADMVQIMNYDFHVFNKYKNPLVGFNAPLHKMRAEVSVLGEMNSEASMNTWFELGLPKNKSYFGIPTYARSYQLLTHYLHKPYSPATKSRPELTNYEDVCIFAKDGYYTNVWNHNAQAPYLYGKDGLWISYENERSILAKMAFARKYGVYGVMVFSIGSDDFNGECGYGKYPLLTKIATLAKKQKIKK